MDFDPVLYEDVFGKEDEPLTDPEEDDQNAGPFVSLPHAPHNLPYYPRRPLSNPMDCDPVIYEEVFGKEDEPLTDLEEDEQSNNASKKCQNRRLPKTVENEILRGFKRKDSKSISAARESAVTFQNVYLRRLIEGREVDTPESITEWLDEHPRIALDAEGIPLVLHVPQWQSRSSLVIFNQSCHQLAEDIPPTTGDGADKNCRNLASSYHHEEGQICGQVKIVTGWHAIGHPNDTPVPSSSMLGSGRKYVGSTKALSAFKMLSRRINGVLDILDPGAAEQYKTLQKVSMEELEYLRAFNALNQSYWQGRIILYNRQTPPHRDTRNPPAEWTPLHAGGGFTEGGELFIDELQLRLRYLPGDLIFIRGRLLTHFVEPWSGGQRISAVYFTHEDFWKSFNLHLSP